MSAALLMAERTPDVVWRVVVLTQLIHPPMGVDPWVVRETCLPTFGGGGTY